MNLKKTINQHIEAHGEDAVIFIMSYDDDVLLSAKEAIQKEANVKVELCSFPRYYNDLDTAKLIVQLKDAKPTLIINAAAHQWLQENVFHIGKTIDILNTNEGQLMMLTDSNPIRSFFCIK